MQWYRNLSICYYWKKYVSIITTSTVKIYTIVFAFDYLQSKEAGSFIANPYPPWSCNISAWKAAYHITFLGTQPTFTWKIALGQYNISWMPPTSVASPAG